MRRFDVERNDTGGGRGFRIIEGGGRYLEPLTPPPPPRAPEPYKVVPSSSALGRAHRRSSFVIIAETRPATPSSRSPSPTLLPTGRVSPFRGRGFKGPLPHAQSRPQSPDNRQRAGRAYGRYDRRASVSQQNSPKRSLIPQPTRRRSVSLSKNNETKEASPKFGRRAQVPRKIVNGPNQLSVGGNVSRRHSLRAPDLSPIQGTPTRPNETAARFRSGNSLVAKVSPVKTRNNLTVPKINGNGRRTTSQDRPPVQKVAIRGGRRFIEDKKSNVEDDSRTKIPVRRGSIVAKNGANLPTNRFIAKNPPKPAARAVKAKNDVIEQQTVSSGDGNLPGSSDNSKENEKSSLVRAETPPSESKNRESDLGLIDLLKQSSGATGTSSVVNTTTTTAVQPLQIDGIMLEKDRENGDKKKSTSTPSPGSLEPSPSSGLSSLVIGENANPKTTKTGNKNEGTSSGEKKNEAREKDSGGSSTTTQLANNTSQRNASKLEDPTTTKSAPNKEQSNAAANNGQASREKTLVGASGNSKKNLLGKNGAQEGRRGETRLPSGNPGSRSNHSNGTGNANQKSVAREPPGSGRTETIRTVENSISGKAETAGNVVQTVAAGNSISENTDNPKNGPEADSTVPRNVAASKNSVTTTTNASVRPDDTNADSNKSRGSDNSLKSSNGMSTVSADSVRSTDTGVSVNTVKGVSSAREKRGMHVMKRSDEIETLSGNVMHLERNGEPAILDIAEGPELPEDQTRLGRFRKSLSRFRDRFPNMRCLGCRRNQKGQAWMGERPRQTEAAQRNEPPNSEASKHPGNSKLSRVWTSFKHSCRCTRLRECQCCRRTARITPVESASCCPPERRCGALCGRLFSCCKCCNRSEAQTTRSIRAKHSLTSVAPPPLSEEHRAKIPEVLVEHNSVMRGAIPCLPVPIAWFCLVWNVLVPGSGTVWSGFFTLCVGQPRFSITAGPRARFGALVVNLIVGVSQFFTVLFCLVGWGWSIWWGVTMIRLARKYKRFRASEAANNDLEARGGDQTGISGGVPSVALRGMERAR
ncbi:protein stum [Venturia canescens]|uniref:protein stum n=1 Tax=Venturia canescens TaxID=32260 RepID=UPI001C9D00EC|nr:protein stum [Venturia canescens]